MLQVSLSSNPPLSADHTCPYMYNGLCASPLYSALPLRFACLDAVRFLCSITVLLVDAKTGALNVHEMCDTLPPARLAVSLATCADCGHAQHQEAAHA